MKKVLNSVQEDKLNYLKFKYATASAVQLVSHMTGTCFCTFTIDCLLGSLSSPIGGMQLLLLYVRI